MSLRPARRREGPAPYGAFRLLPSATAARASSCHTLSEVVAVGWRQRAVDVHRPPGAPTGDVVPRQTLVGLAERRRATHEDIAAWIDGMITKVVDQSPAIREVLVSEFERLLEAGYAENVIINQIAESLPSEVGTIDAWYRLSKEREDNYHITTIVCLHNKGMQGNVDLPGSETFSFTATEKVPMTDLQFDNIAQFQKDDKGFRKHVQIFSKVMGVNEDTGESILNWLVVLQSDGPRNDASEFPDVVLPPPNAVGPRNKFMGEIDAFDRLIKDAELTPRHDLKYWEEQYKQNLKGAESTPYSSYRPHAEKIALILTHLEMMTDIKPKAMFYVDIMETIRSTLRTCLTHIVNAPLAPGPFASSRT